jgi:hypothetical protein
MSYFNVVKPRIHRYIGCKVDLNCEIVVVRSMADSSKYFHALQNIVLVVFFRGLTQRCCPWENLKLSRCIARNYYRKAKSCFGNGGMETRPLRNQRYAANMLSHIYYVTTEKN